MEAKYYTPQVDEFHINFEYEFLNENDVWIKTTPTEISTKNFEEQLYGLRVKYLDKEDIESLGFVLKPKLSPNHAEQFLNKNNIQLTDYGNIIVIDTYYSCDSTIFKGKIKNKSELKKVLKMLEIE